MSRFIHGTFKEQIHNIKLHWFCGSSLQAYSSDIYYICATTNLGVKVNLICSKTKVLPTNVLSFINEINTICIKGDRKFGSKPCWYQ